MGDARIPVAIVELILDSCEHEFGVAPCTAVVPDGRNNYIDYSTFFGFFGITGWYSTFSTITPGQSDPLGGTSASRFTVTSGPNLAELTKYGITAPYAAPARFFVWVKRGNRDVEQFQIYNATTFTGLLNDASWTWSTFSGVNCSVVETAADGWVRLQFIVNSGINAGDEIHFAVANVLSKPSNTGDQTLIFGAQACFPAYTSDFRYVATSGAVVAVDPNITGTGTTECFNTFPTCQDKPNYSKITKTWRFANQRLDDLQEEGEAPTFPVLLGVSLAPTELTPRDGLGVRASCTVSLTDFVYNDEGVDPYRATRRGGADWENKSTFARRFLARNANYENRIMKVITGFRDENGVFDLSTFTTRYYIIQNVTWPDANGNWSIIGKDPLRLADADRAVWPRRARIRVTEAVDTLGTLLLCEDTEGRLAADFAAGQEYIRIGEEIMLMTDVAVSGTLAAVTVQRATIPSFYPGPQFNIAATIEVGAGVTPCYLYDSVSLPAVLFDFLNEGAGIDASFLPIADWEAAMTLAGRSSLRLSALIPEPTAVKDLITEITQLNVNTWWNDRENKVEVQAVLVNPPLAASWTDRTNILQDSIDIAASSRTRISQSWIYYGHQWPLAEMDKLESWYSIENFSDLEAEADEFFASVALQETRTRWLPVAQGADAVAMAINIVLRYRYGKVGITVMVDPKDSAAWTGDAVSLLSYAVVDSLGNPTPVIMTILMAEAQWSDAGFLYRYTGEGQATGILAPQVREAAITSDSLPDYETQTVAQRMANCSICANSGQFSDGNPAYTLAG